MKASKRVRLLLTALLALGACGGGKSADEKIQELVAQGHSNAEAASLVGWEDDQLTAAEQDRIVAAEQLDARAEREQTEQENLLNEQPSVQQQVVVVDSFCQATNDPNAGVLGISAGHIILVYSDGRTVNTLRDCQP